MFFFNKLFLLAEVFILQLFKSIKYVGNDENENYYYEYKNRKGYHNMNKRVCLYRKNPFKSNYNEPTSVSSDWFLWLHYTAKNPPLLDYEINKQSWSLNRIVNNTAGYSHKMNKKNHTKYKPWQPK